MSRDEVAALARAFSAHLVHLQAFRGLRYVGADPMPRSEPESVEGVQAVDAQVQHEQGALELPAPIPAAPAQPESVMATQARERSPEYRVQPAASEGAAPEGGAPPATAAMQPPQQPRTKASQWPAARKLAYLRDTNVGDCRRCPLSRTRRQLVFGVGSPEADLMFVGEAPGAEEDRRGEPFVGPAGQRLDGWIRWLGLSREQVYIANVLKCRPPRNRDPQPVEIERCSPFLHAQIRAIEPRVIVALGRFAGCLLLGQDRRMYEMRGQIQRYVEPKTGTEFPLVVTYHPSYVLRSERDPRGQPDRRGSIKTEDQKVLDDLARAGALLRRAAERPR